MKVFILSIMLLNYFLLVLFSVHSFPTSSLNEKNQEISWEAWLLVDDQRQTQEVIPKRRITPKSVFVAPIFSPEKLPPCAEGYSSDPMGRCVKIIKIDEDKHLDFLVSKLNERFGNLDYEEAFIDESNSEPTRLDIPIDYYDYSNDNPEGEFENMAIIVTPTTREVIAEKDENKLDKRNNENKYEEELKSLVTSTFATTTIVDQETTTNNAEQQTTTTVEDDLTTSTEMSTNNVETANSEETTTLSASTATEDYFTSTTLTETSEVPTTDVPQTTTTPKITTYRPVATTYHPYIDVNVLSSSKTKNFVKFPEDDELVLARSHPEGNFVKFPDVKLQQESLGHHTRNVDEFTSNFNNEIITSPPEPLESARFFPSEKSENSGRFKFVNQHKKLWAVDEQRPPNKPIVLRFSRKHLNFDVNKFKNSEFYRSLPMDDLTYLFGYKNTAKTNHR